MRHPVFMNTAEQKLVVDAKRMVNLIKEN